METVINSMVTANKIISRGLATILLIGIMTTLSVNTSYGLTVDDLRAYIGKTVEPVSGTSIVVDNSNQSKVSDSQSGTSDTFTLEQAISNFNESEKLFTQRMETSKDTVSIIKLMNHAIALQNNINTVRENQKGSNSSNTQVVSSSISDFDLDMLSSTKEQERIIDNDKTFGSVFYDIGYFGDSFKAPTEGALKLVTPYGYKKLDDKTYESKHNGVDIQAYEDTNIKAVLNGMISKIEHQKSGNTGDTIIVYHGDSLYTIYHHLEIDKNIYKGKQVRGGDILGKVINTKIDEPDKTNHLLFQVVLDGDYINPLYLFGHSGENMFKTWSKSTSEVYALQGHEKPYHEDSMIIENINKNVEPVVKVEGQLEVDYPNYTRPDPGITKNMQEELGAK